MCVRLNLEGREKWNEMERQVHKKRRNPIPLQVCQRHTQIQPEPTKDNSGITLTASRIPAPSPIRVYHTQMQTQIHACQGSTNSPVVSQKQLSQSEPDTSPLEKNIFSVIMLITTFTSSFCSWILNVMQHLFLLEKKALNVPL